MKRILFLLLCGILVSSLANAQMQNQEENALWKKADSLLDQGLPESAAQVIQDLYATAQRENNQENMLRAQLLQMRARCLHQEDADSVNIAFATAQIQATTFPLRAVWSSIAAQLYQKYYSNYQYEILERGIQEQPNEAAGSDFEQWDARQFFNHIAALYLHSLDEAERLKNVPIGTFDSVLQQGQNSRNLRPTLFDFLAFRALAFFEDEDYQLPQPVYQFVLDDSAAFAPAAEFIAHPFESRDTASEQLTALRLYQKLLALHAEDSSPDAFIDADLQRLQFAFQASVDPEKTTHYRQALEQIASRYASHPLAALASFRLVDLMLHPNSGTGGDNDDEGHAEPGKELDLRAVVHRLDALIAKYPASEGGNRALHLRQQILAPTLSLKSEEAVLPDMPSRVLIQYKNVPELYVRVLKLDAEEFFNQESGASRDSIQKRLLLLPALQAFHLSLPGTEDLAAHRTEIKLDPLPVGMYAILISAQPSFSESGNAMSYTLCQSTRLAVITTNQSSGGSASKQANGYVLQRESGVPLAGVTVTLFQNVWRGNGRGSQHIKKETLHTDASGAFRVQDGEGNFSGLRLQKGEDVFYTEGYLGFYRQPAQEAAQKKVFFFTDRSIYRPGQSIFFKAIFLKQSPQSRNSKVLSDVPLILKFFNANNQEIASQTLKTNEWGSVSGSFQAPQSGLNGGMRLVAYEQGGKYALGNAHVSVEEYKRPRFRVEWDTVKAEYALGETVSLSGWAQAYAGNRLDGATVKYRVMRRVEWPFVWCAWRFPGQGGRIDVQQMAQGTRSTDASGAFKISFPALPDKSVDPRGLPVFRYVVSVEVTDLNGETRTGEKELVLGYRSLQIEALIPERASRKDLSALQVRSENLNGTFVAATLNISVARLQMPEQVLRKRPWPAPDRFVLSEAAFRKAFPKDAYRDEDDYRNWPVAAHTASFSWRSAPHATLALPAQAFPQNGWYCISLKAKDKQGRPVEEKKFVQVWDASAAGRAYTPLCIWPREMKLQPGMQADWTAFSELGAVHLIRSEQSLNQEETSFKSLAANGRDPGHRTISESDRGGLSVSYLLLRDNRVYTATVQFQVPWSNKDLQLEWETHRDKLQPGQQETWTLRVLGDKKDLVACEVLAALYDASLDAFLPHSWHFGPLFPLLYPATKWKTDIGFGTASPQQICSFPRKELPAYPKSYDVLRGLEACSHFGRVFEDRIALPAGGMRAESRLAFAPPVSKKDEEVDAGIVASAGQGKESPQPEPDAIPVRKNLQETAFFYPQLHTDSSGAVSFSFTIPEALTEWKFMAFAHTQDLRSGFLSGKIKTQKDLMVQPGLPRFLRQGDALRLSTKIVNLSEAALQGTARIEIVDALSGKLLNTAFRLAQTAVPFQLQKDASGSVSWLLHVPESCYNPVVIRISAQAGNFSDGEENTLPVLSNRMRITETLPLWMNGAGQKDFSFEKLLAAASSPTLAQEGLSVEYTTNPLWYVVKALPYLVEFPHECSEQTFNRFYAQMLAAHILNEAPRVRSVFKQWQETADSAALRSPLEQNQELKTALLEETPWVQEAQDEAQQRAHIARLFESPQLQAGLDKALQKLEDMMLPDGGWPWFKGSPRPDRHITQYILTGIGRLRHLGALHPTQKGAAPDARVWAMAEKALPFLDREMEHDYRELLRKKADLKAQHLGHTEAQYLYMRSFFKDIPQKQLSTEAKAFYQQQARQFWPRFNPYTKGMLALALSRAGDPKTSAAILQSLRETATLKEELGLYWPQMQLSWWWYDAPVEAQSLLIECFDEIAQDTLRVQQMKRWLLKQKQTRHWSSTTATADACYALLLTPSAATSGLNEEPEVAISLGDTSFRASDFAQEAGSGFFQLRIPGAKLRPEMGHIRLSVTTKEPQAVQASWGAVYWQYFEDLDQITAAATPLVLRKEMFIERNSDRGPVLIPLATGAQSGAPLRVGDKVWVRMEIQVDRDMEYVHLKDTRAACFEPLNVLSGYHWQGGLGYYESTRDASSNFFFDQLPKGKYVFEYPMYVTNTGDFSAGLATIQCMYAPEFSAHSAGLRVQVQ